MALALVLQERLRELRDRAIERQAGVALHRLEACPGIKLLVTSQRPTGDLRTEREASCVVRRIDSPAACRQLFANAAGSPLGDRLHSVEVDALLELLDGHPRLLVLVASQIRDGGANLASILIRLRDRGDESVLAAELLESSTDWNEHDRLRAERLVSSLHLAYRPLLEHAPGAAELFAWLGVLPRGCRWRWPAPSSETTPPNGSRP